MDLLQLSIELIPLLQCAHVQLQQDLMLLADLFIIALQAFQL